MATHTFNEAKFQIGDANVDWDSNTIKVSLHMTNTTIDTENDGVVTNANFTTSDEFDGGAPYAAGGVTLANRVKTKNDASDRAEFSADNTTWLALPNGTRAIAGALIYKDVGGVWANGIPLAWIEFASPQNPGGSDFTVKWDSGATEGDILRIT